MKAINWTEIYKKHQGLWVALKQDEETVIGSGKTLVEALQSARENGYENPIMTRMPRNLSAFVGGAL